MTIEHKASELLRLHTDPAILQLVNVWDAISARVVADLPETTALATASHSIAASFGYDDGEHISVDLMIATVGRIAAVTELPVTADLEAGYGNPAETTRKAIGVGIVGMNLEDQLKPLGESVAAVEAVVSAANAEGVPFVLNARTDAFLWAEGRAVDDVTADAIARGRAYLDAGASCFFVPGRLEQATIEQLVDALGRQRISVIGHPGSLAPEHLQELGVARISYGPWPQRIALTALADAASALYAGGTVPDRTRLLS
jgi:2-methylisocitrate lyase-like PEP mutase family enzyme